jgi:flagellar hook-associated protein 1 FlgK
MPISSFYGLQTSLRGLLAQQRSLDTTSHNIANASTPGYSRQEAVLTAAPATDIPAGMLQNGGGAQLGAGVDVQVYRRIRDNFLDLQYRGQFTSLSEQEARSDSLHRVELTTGEPGDTGINTLLGEYWNAWSDLADAPDEQAAQSALLQKSASLADAFSALRSQLLGAQSDAQAEYDDLTRSSASGAAPGEIEATAREIAGLNDTIKKFMTAGDVPNDLMDKRDLLLDKLSGYGQVSVTDNHDGSIDVTFGGDTTSPPLVKGATVNWDGKPVWPPSGPGGRLGGLLSLASKGGTIDGYIKELDAVAMDVVRGTNGVFAGMTPPPTPPAVPPVFWDPSTTSAANMAVNPKLKPSELGGGPGAGASDNTLARQVANLRGGQVDQAYRALIARMGTEVSDADRKTSNMQALADSINDRRESVAGVSLDEEMSNLVRFQRAYQASSRAMSTMDEMLDVLINRTGKVGL